MVLTQPIEVECGYGKVGKFPYHYGSHATVYGGNRDPQRNTFPYHYGSHATPLTQTGGGKTHMFPYHYGSHATAFITK